ncbi:serine hydrolase domain-containing protein [Terrimonas pollutisoli]|uniref:serine hydrolase domain-containing protein n=1 Tax=Terrimonas pollutisoli TaxID=3034147 RepID=UPI0023EB6A04|nr:serine hydrolase domain-containing protein [Terrimonas sp. H1YJ31]
MKQLLVLFFFTLLVKFSFSQLLREASPELAGMSSERLQRIDKVLQEYVDKKWIAGGSAIIARNGKIVYYKATGYDDTQNKIALKRDAIFRIASQTKAITSAAIMMLYEEGKFLLKDPVSKYIPEYKNQQVLDKFNAADTTYTTVPAKRDITIHDLLTHTSGIGYAQIGSKEATAIYAKNGIVGGIGVGKILLADKMKKLGSLPLLHQPGDQWTYGLNTDLLGYLVEVVSGMSLADFFSKRIFEPLGMKDTYFYLPSEKHNRLVTLYTEDSLKQVIKAADAFDIKGEFTSDYPNSEGTYFSGGGGLSSTAMDYAIFMQMLLNGGEYNGKRILSRASVNMMTVSQYDKLNWPDNKMGLGFSIHTEKSLANSPLSPGSYEWGGMFSSSYWIDPKEKIVAQLFLNQYPQSHGEIHDKFKILVYQAIK